ncbi:hypothetical protein [Undibacterium crateris]|uniref:hypothetical protein n=1 Tax=Undibacterium crateris TaxID=2528175 RepID=UPI001389BE99|nr:hypothetical protein [Undibacterium crateris]NDI85094.1 hypothetical protein [Undibacterium crateris]
MEKFSKLIQTKHGNNELLNEVISSLRLRNDAALARLLGVAPPVISKIRSFRLPIGSVIAIRIHEESRFSIKKIKKLMTGQLGGAEKTGCEE